MTRNLLFAGAHSRPIRPHPRASLETHPVFLNFGWHPTPYAKRKVWWSGENRPAAAETGRRN